MLYNKIKKQSVFGSYDFVILDYNYDLSSFDEKSDFFLQRRARHTRTLIMYRLEGGNLICKTYCQKTNLEMLYVHSTQVDKKKSQKWKKVKVPE